MMTHLRVEPLFDNLRSEPRFKELLRRMHFERFTDIIFADEKGGLPEQAARE